MIYCRKGKRVLDFMIALLISLLFVPIIFVGYCLVRLSSRGPGFFVQERLGCKGKTFKLFKLRTMHVNAERQLGQTSNADPDVFMVGRILRRFKVDEFPQILNVLKGDMSLVGPRPGLPSLLEEMPDWARERLSVRPGLTGLAQINGNVQLSWEDRWKYDVRYSQNVTLINDLRILFRTAFVVFLGEAKFRRKP